jgi:hypothetical protein
MERGSESVAAQRGEEEIKKESSAMEQSNSMPKGKDLEDDTKNRKRKKEFGEVQGTQGDPKKVALSFTLRDVMDC